MKGINKINSVALRAFSAALRVTNNVRVFIISKFADDLFDFFVSQRPTEIYVGLR